MQLRHRALHVSLRLEWFVSMSLLFGIGPMTEGAAIRGLGFLPSRFAASYATAISGDGNVVVGFVEETAHVYQGRRAFRWTNADGMQDLGVLTNAFTDSDQSMAFGVSGDGRVIGGQSNMEGFRWTPTNGLSGIGFLQADHPGSSVEAVSGDGATLVGYGFIDSLFRAVVWREAQGLLPLGTGTALDQGSFARAISSDGTTVGGDSGAFGFQWSSANGLTSLGDLSSCPDFRASSANAVSANGGVIVGTSYPLETDCLEFNESFDAFRWTATEGMKRLDRLPNQMWAEASAISADGNLMGGYTYLNPEGDVALLWNPGGEVFRLWDVLVSQAADLGHWVGLSRVTGISADGRTLTGSGLNRDGKTEAFVASLAGAGSMIRLQAGRAVTGRIEIRWHAELTNCVVEARPVDGTSTWQPLTNRATINGGELVVTLDPDPPSRWIRLRCP